jgi:tRNA pseudouridine13 synthase
VSVTSASDGAVLEFPAYPHALGPPDATAVMRARPEDFFVDEQLGFEPDGEGEHLLVQLEKTSANTAWAARQLAAFTGAASRDVSFSGLKDRHAVTRQWFSIHIGNRPDPDFTGFDAEGLTVLLSARHRRKLRRGSHASNAFRITLRELSGPVDARLHVIRTCGVPNYFGEQRYGHSGSNLRAAHQMFTRRRGRSSRDKRSLYLSAARSCLFDEVLSRRVQRGDWDRLLRGDVAMLAGSSSWFAVEAPDADELPARLAAFDLHPSGPLWGAGDLPTAGDVATLERAAAERYAVLRDGLEGSNLRQQRRALRLVPEEFRSEQDGELLQVSFTLPPGAYATSVLRELVQLNNVMR